MDKFILYPTGGPIFEMLGIDEREWKLQTTYIMQVIRTFAHERVLELDRQLGEELRYGLRL